MKTYTLADAAAVLNVARETMLALAASGAVPGAKIGSQWVFDEGDLQAYLRAQIEKQTQERIERFAAGAAPRVRSAFGQLREVKQERRRRGSKPDLARAEVRAAGVGP